jgi:hypothetical protein
LKDCKQNFDALEYSSKDLDRIWKYGTMTEGLEEKIDRLDNSLEYLDKIQKYLRDLER